MKQGQCIISGYVNGRKFRPSNWHERLCEVGASFDPLKRVMRYSEHLHPRQCEQYSCSVYVNFNALSDELVRYINWFIESNGMEAVPLPSERSPVLSEVINTRQVSPRAGSGLPEPQWKRRKKVAA